MAEHEEQIFEHGFKAKLEQLDAQIKIPEIPDAQSIFERAESEKGKTVPFRKYTKYIAAAAAIVLICVAIPAMGMLDNGLGIKADNSARSEEAAYAPDFEPETAVEEAPEIPEDAKDSIFEAEVEIPEEENPELYYALNSFFRQYSYSNKTTDAAKPADTDSVDSIEAYVNKKRSINIDIEPDSVSVRVLDNAANAEIINAFWVEGTYRNSYADEENGVYIIELVKVLSPEDVENNVYLPMAGDAEKGNYTLSENDVTLSGEITRGEILITVEIRIGTGEYKIKAEVV